MLKEPKASEPQVHEYCEELQKFVRKDLTAFVGNLEGQWLTLIDATFSDPQQRKAMKDIVRRMIWDWDTSIIRMVIPNSTSTILPDGRVVPNKE